jgi:hypothetical protein
LWTKKAKIPLVVFLPLQKIPPLVKYARNEIFQGYFLSPAQALKKLRLAVFLGANLFPVEKYSSPGGAQKCLLPRRICGDTHPDNFFVFLKGLS